jgi:hypothetical protein
MRKVTFSCMRGLQNADLGSPAGVGMQTPVGRGGWDIETLAILHKRPQFMLSSLTLLDPDAVIFL